ncbi:hypothetical protein [Hymenobacter tenuis]
MTRASLLHILDHVNGISEAEVRELEQLAAAFPYCQTAHMLLAKAAHDRGSMLASQRLRRAATYAPDRELLRQLLEQTAAPVPTVEAAPEQPLSAPEKAVASVAAAIPAAPIVAEPATIVTTPEQEPNLFEAVASDSVASAETITDTEPEATYNDTGVQITDPEPVEQVTEEPQISESVNPLALSSSETETSEEEPTVITLTEHSALPEANEELADFPTEEHLADLPGATPVESEVEVATDAQTSDELSIVLPGHETLAPATSETSAPTTESITLEQDSEKQAADDDILPAMAPPIRPPAEAGISRFEFGLTEPALPEPSSYQLPELSEDPDSLEALPSVIKDIPIPIVTAPFHADEDLGYALAAGSRLGYDLQPHDGFTLDLPLTTFFEPDALLLAHMAAHRPKPKASSLDLINRFLTNKPRIKSPAGVPLPADEQTDLSVRSTSVAPALASESLAKIMVRQGKKDKAIEIYERLMERQPEKKAYFAEQIQQLQQLSE